jgi:sulfite exporter TauE/SafE
MIAALLTGLALGLASSAHCAAMCGPLVLAIGRLAAPSRQAQLRHACLHHAGRAIVYAMLALPAGAAGELLVVRGFGRALAIGSGVVMLLAAANAMHVKGLDRITSRASEAAARAFAPALRFAAGRPFAGPLVTGALNGLLPCGLVYVALAAAVASGRIAAAIGLMAGFAAGTSVVLIAMAMASATMSAAARRRLRPAGPIVLVLTAIVLIGRGVAPPRHHAGGPAPAAVHVRH